jgi:hypothetical protein
MLEPLAMCVLDEMPGFALRRRLAIAGGRARVEELGHIACRVRLLDHNVLVGFGHDVLQVGEQVARTHDEPARLGAHFAILLRANLDRRDAAGVVALAGDRVSVMATNASLSARMFSFTTRNIDWLRAARTSRSSWRELDTVGLLPCG